MNLASVMDTAMQATVKLLLATTLLLASLLPVSAQAPIRLLCLGDSLTENDPGYRGPLQKMLEAAGFTVKFVGPKKSSSPDGKDLDHAGYGGFTIGPGPSKADAWAGGRGNIRAVLETALESKPDVVLLMVGTNDYFNIGDLDPTYVAERDGAKRLADLALAITERCPNAKVLVASVPPVGWDKGFASGLNASLPGLLAGIRNVTFVDMNKLCGFQAGDWSPDNLHPSESGYEKLAMVWYDSLKTILPPPPTPRS